jgi:indolepyruvate ferredoxin oxidoreductase
MINPDVCEGCGDCSVQSNCVSVQPLETELGRKRTIDQSSCNKDFSCLKGFCPSFVTIEGGALRKAAGKKDGLEALLAKIPTPAPMPMQDRYDILVTGIGGTGVLTVTAVLGMAAHVEGKGATIMDMTGMAQKGGAVLSHLRIGAAPENIFAPRLGPGMASLILGCDLVVTTGKEVLQTARSGETRAIVNSHVVPTAQFQANAKIDFGSARMVKSIDDVLGAERTRYVDGTTLATKILGDSIATNMFMMGFAAQSGWLPLTIESIEEAIRLNGIAVDSNLRTFGWGRVAAADLPAAQAVADKAAGADIVLSKTLDEVIEKRVELLTAYQNADYAAEYKSVVEQVRKAEAAVSSGTALTSAVARNLAKLMAYKDEYEVARLQTSSAQAARINAQFDGEFKLKFHLAPPLIARKDPSTGRPRKMEFGAWVLPLFNLLKKGKELRGGAFDIFGYTAERKMERRLITEYRAMLTDILGRLTRDNLATAVELAELPDEIRGYGYVKDASVVKAEARKADLLERFSAPVVAMAAE